jgi:predicted nucleic acid-binding protein
MTPPAPARVVLDASAAVALLADSGPAGQWVETAIAGTSLLAPELLPFEVGNILRRHALAGLLDASAAALAHADLVALPIDLYPYAAVADRVWELRANLTEPVFVRNCGPRKLRSSSFTVYDASYVALAELLAASLVTLDARLVRAPGARCPMLAYPGLL